MNTLEALPATETSAEPLAPASDAVAGLAARVAGVDPAMLDAEALVGYLQDCHRLAAAAEGQRLVAAAQLAQDEEGTRSAGIAGSAMDCAAAEVSLALALTPRGADRLVGLGLDLRERLEATFAGLCAGEIDFVRARIFSEETATLDPELVTTVETTLLPVAARLTPSQLRARLRRLVMQADPEAAQQRHADKVSERGLRVWDEDDATACLAGTGLSADKALGAFQYVDTWARHIRRAETPGTSEHPARSLDQIRADLFCDLLTGQAPTASQQEGPAPATLPALLPETPTPTPAFSPVGRLHLTVPLDTLTGQSRQPAEAAGFGPLLAEIAQNLALRALTPGSMHCWTVHDHHGHPIAHGTSTYRPTPRMRAEITARNPTCSFPTCSQPATRCDLDHTVPYEPDNPAPTGAGTGTGPTCPCNLAPLCRRHHRLKQHPEWHTHQPPNQPDQLTWITPTGITYRDPIDQPLPRPIPPQRE